MNAEIKLSEKELEKLAREHIEGQGHVVESMRWVSTPAYTPYDQPCGSTSTLVVKVRLK